MARPPGHKSLSGALSTGLSLVLPAACPTPRDYPVKSFGKVQGYHSNDALVDLTALGLRSDLSEPDRGRRCWKGQPSARDAVSANRRRIRGERGRRLLRCRGELLERPFAHVCETGGMRRVHLRGHPNIRKRLLVHVAGCNLGLLLRHLIGVGTPRSLQGRAAALFRALFRQCRDCGAFWDASGRSSCHTRRGHLPRAATRASTPLRECEDLRLRLLTACLGLIRLCGAPHNRIKPSSVRPARSSRSLSKPQRGRITRHRTRQTKTLGSTL